MVLEIVQTPFPSAAFAIGALNGNGALSLNVNQTVSVQGTGGGEGKIIPVFTNI